MHLGRVWPLCYMHMTLYKDELQTILYHITSNFVPQISDNIFWIFKHGMEPKFLVVAGILRHTKSVLFNLFKPSNIKWVSNIWYFSFKLFHLWSKVKCLNNILNSFQVDWSSRFHVRIIIHDLGNISLVAKISRSQVRAAIRTAHYISKYYSFKNTRDILGACLRTTYLEGRAKGVYGAEETRTLRRALVTSCLAIVVVVLLPLLPLAQTGFEKQCFRR
jgi:hypothetical protein